MAAREEVFERTVFSVGDRPYLWADVVTAARAWSAWSAIERRAAEAIAAPGDDVASAELEAAQNEFRYSHSLLSADDLEGWLADWGVTVEAWIRQVRGTLLSEQGSGSSGTVTSGEHLDEAAWAEAVCSGELERVARRLAEACALHAAVGNPEPGELDGDVLAHMGLAHRQFRDSVITDVALERKLQDVAVGWTRIEGAYLAHRSEDVVREAALGVREDGRGLEEMARLAGARFVPAAVFYVLDLEAELKARLLAAAPGELCGPVRVGKEHWLLEVGARVPPSLDDEEIRVRAATAVADAAVQQEVLRRVRWHVR